MVVMVKRGERYCCRCSGDSNVYRIIRPIGEAPISVTAAQSTFLQCL
jgi:hypothetical protein